jgi:hypothetical protein
VPAPPVLRGAHSSESDPQFLNHFLQHSRLHFIGSWRSHAINVVAEELRVAANTARFGENKWFALGLPRRSQAATGGRSAMPPFGGVAAGHALVSASLTPASDGDGVMSAGSGEQLVPGPRGTAVAPPPPPPPRLFVGSEASGGTTVVHVDFDCFFAAVSLLKHPELATKPVVVSHGSAGARVPVCLHPS